MAKEMKIVIYDDVVKEIQSMKAKSEKVVSRTVSDFKSRGPGWVSQEVRKIYNISAHDINEDRKKGKKGRSFIKVQGTKIENATLVYNGRPLTITHFNMTPTTSPKLSDKRIPIHFPGVGFRMVRQRKKIKVKATIFKGDKKPITGNYDTPIFIQENPKKAGQYLPFQRTGRKMETGKDELVTIKRTSIEQMIENETVSKNIHARINKELGERLEHHLEQALK